MKLARKDNLHGRQPAKDETVTIMYNWDRGWLIVWDNFGNRMQYLYYSKRERLRKFKETFGYRYRRNVEMYDMDKEIGGLEEWLQSRK